MFRELTPSQVNFVDSGATLQDVQSQLEASLGVPLTLTAGASDVRYRGWVSGESGMAFVEELAAKLNLEWAIGSDSIYLSPEGVSGSASFDVPSTEVGYRALDVARRNFEGMGSNIRVSLQNNQLIVTGIPAWVDLFAQAVVPELLENAGEGVRTSERDTSGAIGTPVGAPASEVGGRSPGVELQTMVFRLNNAYVDDKSVSLGSSAILFPGVATLFRQFTGVGSVGQSDVQPVRTSVSTGRVPRLDPLAGERRLYWDEPPPAAPPPAFAPPAPAINAEGPYVIADPRTNSLIVRDKPSMLGPYTELIKILDRPVEMVQLDAFVIDIKASRFNEFGLALSWSNSSWNSPNVAPGGLPPANANLILQATQGARLLARIRALESEGESQVLTVPSVVTQNNLEASFSARESFYVRVSGNLDASLNRVTVETLLSVTPLVEQFAEGDSAATLEKDLNRRIRMLINIQDGQVDDNNSQVVDTLPRTIERQITTQAVVRGGETLIIGGQMVRKEDKTESGFPFIRRLPLLGALTNSRSKKFDEYVRIYVVRPKLLLETGVAGAAPAASGQQPLTQSVPPGPATPIANPTALPSVTSEQTKSNALEAGPAPALQIESVPPEPWPEPALASGPGQPRKPEPESTLKVELERSPTAGPDAPVDSGQPAEVGRKPGRAAIIETRPAPWSAQLPLSDAVYTPIEPGNNPWSFASGMTPSDLPVRRMMTGVKRRFSRHYSKPNWDV